MQDEQAHKVYKDLNLKFMAALDQELILSLAKRVSDQSSHFSALRQLGQGSCFRVYEMTLGQLRIVLKVPVTAFLGFEKSLPLDKTWNETLNLLKDRGSYLVPPFQNYSFKDSFIQVMPLFDLQKISNESLAKLDEDFNKSLSTLGLRNNDALQIGFFKGIPFALDLSDITKV